MSVYFPAVRADTLTNKDRQNRDAVLPCFHLVSRAERLHTPPFCTAVLLLSE